MYKATATLGGIARGNDRVKNDHGCDSGNAFENVDALPLSLFYK